MGIIKKMNLGGLHNSVPPTIPIGVKDLKPEMELIDTVTGEVVTVNYTERHKVNYARSTGTYSMHPQDFVKRFALKK